MSNPRGRVVVPALVLLHGFRKGFTPSPPHVFVPISCSHLGARFVISGGLTLVPLACIRPSGRKTCDSVEASRRVWDSGAWGHWQPTELFARFVGILWRGAHTLVRRSMLYSRQSGWSEPDPASTVCFITPKTPVMQTVARTRFIRR
jgi:hypothetical protein